MKTLLQSFFAATLLVAFISTDTISTKEKPFKDSNNIDILNTSGYNFLINHLEINNKYSEFGSALFKNKLIIVSSKKIGALGNGVDKKTNEPYTDLFCLDINSHGSLSNPLLFSRVLNTKHNEGQVSFSSDEKTIYYTRSTRKNSSNYQLFKASLKYKSNGNWSNHIQLTKNTSYSVENPHVSSDGTKLYFSSNRSGGFGGFDIYVAKIRKDGSLGKPENLGALINTSKDEKFPHLSKNGKELYFSSKGHKGAGGFDIFMSKNVSNEYTKLRNLGRDVNSQFDEVAFIYVNKDSGFFSSNKKDSKGSFDLYRFEAETIYQNIEGIVVSNDNHPLSNTTVVLLDEEGNEMERQVTGIDAHYSFKIKAFDNYSIKALKSGFEDLEFKFSSTERETMTYKEILKLSAEVSSVTNK